MTLLATNKQPSLLELESRVEAAFAARLTSDTDLNSEEVSRVSKLDRRLVTAGVTVPEETMEQLRALAKLSNIELKPADQITSHRKVLGPLIVLAKRITYPFIKIHLEKTIEGLRDFCSWSVTLQAKQAVELAKLKNENPRGV